MNGQAAYEVWRAAVPEFVCNVPGGPWGDLSKAVRAGFDAIAARWPQPEPEIRTCYCGTTATVVPDVFPHRDCDGSVSREPQPAPEPPECLASHCPPPGRECDYPECAPTAAELARFAAAGKPRGFVPVAEHAEYIKANQELARSLDEATRLAMQFGGARAVAGARALREKHGLEP